MQVVPISAWVVGADGRVDLRVIGGPFTLLYSQRDQGWFFVQNTYPMKLSRLDQDLFLDLAEACLNG
jgi:hypothetical protein